MRLISANMHIDKSKYSRSHIKNMYYIQASSWLMMVLSVQREWNSTLSDVKLETYSLVLSFGISTASSDEIARL